MEVIQAKKNAIKNVSYMYMKHLLFVEYGISKSQIHSCVKKNVKVKYVKPTEMCDVIPAYLENYREQWDSINIICRSDFDRQQSCLTFMGETITTSSLIEGYDKNRDRIIFVLDAIHGYTDYVYIYTNLKAYSAVLKKVCIDAYYKTADVDVNTAMQKDLFLSTNVTSLGTHMCTEWSVVRGFMKRNEDNLSSILHAKQKLFDKPSSVALN
jgi:hypothetical protein